MKDNEYWFEDNSYSPILDMLIIADFKTYVVYSFYDKDKNPIYVGKSINFVDRYDWHRRKPYYQEIEYIGFRQYNNRAEMDLAELFQIQNKLPKYNKSGKFNETLKLVSFQDFSKEEIFTRSNVERYFDNK